MRPRVVVRRITALLAAYALAMATIFMPLSVSAIHALDVACLTGGVSPTSAPDNVPDSDHVTCGLCVAGCSGPPLPGSGELARPGRTSAPSPQQSLEQTAPARARVGPGLARAPPHSA